MLDCPGFSRAGLAWFRIQASSHILLQSPAGHWVLKWLVPQRLAYERATDDAINPFRLYSRVGETDY